MAELLPLLQSIRPTRNSSFQAELDGDHIWGTIVTGLNQDGRQATPITAPSGEQQENLLNEMYHRHNVNPTDIDYIEAHGKYNNRTFKYSHPTSMHVLLSDLDMGLWPTCEHIANEPDNLSLPN